MSEKQEMIPEDTQEEKDVSPSELSSNPKKILVIGFAIMLLLMGSMFIVAYFLPNYIINEQYHYTKLIEITNQQNLRSERIAKLALRLRLCFEKRPCMDLIEEFKEDLVEWEKEQVKLKTRKYGDEDVNSNLKNLYNLTHKFYAPMLSASKTLLNFKKTIFDKRNKRQVDIIVQMILANEGDYNQKMSEISDFFAERYEARLSYLQNAKFTILIVLALIIILVVFFLYLIVGTRVTGYLNHIETSNEHMQVKNQELEVAYQQLQEHDEETKQNARQLELSHKSLLRTQQELEIVHKEVSEKNTKLENALKELHDKHRLEDAGFIDSSLNKFGELMRWDQNQNIFSWTEKLLEELTPYIKALQAIIFGFEEEREVLSVYGAYGVSPEVFFTQSDITLGQGVIGQVAKSQKNIEIESREGSYFDTNSGTEDIKPRYLFVMPLMYNDTIAGVLELASVKRLAPRYKDLLEKLAPSIAANLSALADQKRINQLFADSQMAQKQLKRSFEQIQENEERFRKLAEVTQEGLLFLQGNTIKDANSVMAKMMGYEETSELLKKPYIDIIDPQYRFEIEEQKIISKGTVHETLALTKTGDSFPIEMQARKVKYGDETVTVISVRDITERKQTEQELEEANRVAGLVKVIEKKNKDIMSSIEYARRIQHAILPSNRLITKGFIQNFILYIPKDIVSGDFYWYAEKNEHALIAAVDCTGHGVPGAFMSIIGSSQLNKIVMEQGITRPARILQKLDEGVSEILNQNEEGSKSRDGMDLGLCSLNIYEKTLSYAGAYRPMYLIRDGELQEFKGDSFPIGGNFKYKKEKKFHDHTVQLQDRDTIYIFSDGYPDQFGGPENRKYMTKRFKKLLLKIQDHDMEEQKEVLSKEFWDWKGDEKQMDDIMVIGLRF